MCGVWQQYLLVNAYAGVVTTTSTAAMVNIPTSNVQTEYDITTEVTNFTKVKSKCLNNVVDDD